jgi:polyhydroxyalkanoate synthesis regulator phasin
MNCIVKAQQLSGDEAEAYLDELFETIQTHILTLPNEEIEAVLDKLQVRQINLEVRARQLRLQPTNSTNLTRCQDLERLARRFYHVRYAVYRLLQPHHPFYIE